MVKNIYEATSTEGVVVMYSWIGYVDKRQHATRSVLRIRREKTVLKKDIQNTCVLKFYWGQSHLILS